MKDVFTVRRSADSDDVLKAVNGIYRKVRSLTAATVTLEDTDSGGIFTLNKADGIAVVLPTAEPGLEFEFYVETALTSGAYSVTAASSADVFTGKMLAIDIAVKNSHIDLNDAVATLGWSIPAADDYILSTNKTTTGGLAGSYWKFTCAFTGGWIVDGTNVCSSGATMIIPFAAA